MRYTASANHAIVPTPSAINGAVHEWDVFYSLLSPPGGQSQGTLFLHERVSPSGNHRLVAVDMVSAQVEANMTFPEYIVDVTARVIQPGTIWNLPIEVIQANPSRNFAVSSAAASPTLMRLTGNIFYAGQPDPNDPSHFTIKIVSSQTQRIVDGWLQDDDRVVLERRFPQPLAATQPN